MKIQKKQKFKVGNQTVISMDDIEIYGNVNGYFILNMWEQCDEEDMDVLPVSYVRCTSLQEEVFEQMLWDDIQNMNSVEKNMNIAGKNMLDILISSHYIVV